MEKLLVFLADGFEEIEALTIVDYLRRAEVEVDTVSISSDKKVTGSHKIPVIADKIIADIDENDYMAVFIPGGVEGVNNLRNNDKVVEIVKKINDENKLVASICAGPLVLDKAKVLKEKKVTSYPTFKDQLQDIGQYIEGELIVEDSNVVTSQGVALAIYEAFKLIEIFKGEDVTREIKDLIQQDKVEKYFGFDTFKRK